MIKDIISIAIAVLLSDIFIPTLKDDDEVEDRLMIGDNDGDDVDDGE